VTGGALRERRGEDIAAVIGRGPSSKPSPVFHDSTFGHCLSTSSTSGPFSSKGSSPGLASISFSKNPTRTPLSTFRADGVRDRRNLADARGV